jgi:hypothetical protein
MDEKWPNYRGMAAWYWMSHQNCLVFDFWWAAVKTIKNLKKSHLGGESTEKRSVIYITAKQKEARLNLAQNEKLDAKGPNAMFCDDNINFDLQLEMWDVDPDWQLKEPEVQRVFCARVKDWEENARRMNDAVAVARLIQKYKSLVFCNPDTGNTFLIYDQNMEFCQGRGNGWFLLAVSANDEGN